MSKHKYPTNWWFEMIVKEIPYQISIDMFDDQDKYDMTKYVIEEISTHTQDLCENCDEDVTEAVTYETADGKILCEECYIQYLAHQRGLVVE